MWENPGKKVWGGAAITSSSLAGLLFASHAATLLSEPFPHTIRGTSDGLAVRAHLLPLPDRVLVGGMVRPAVLLAVQIGTVSSVPQGVWGSYSDSVGSGGVQWLNDIFFMRPH